MRNLHKQASVLAQKWLRQASGEPTLWALIRPGDGMIDATSDKQGQKASFWRARGHSNLSHCQVVQLEGVPSRISTLLQGQWTNPWFADSREAWDVARKYFKGREVITL